MVGGVLAVVCVLLFVGCGLSTGQAECTAGFATVPVNQTPAAMFGSTVGVVSNLDRRQWIMPDINFTCNGLLTMWIVAAEWNSGTGGGGGNTPTEYPHLQIWRRRNDQRDTYVRMAVTTLNTTDSERPNEVYTFPLDPPLEFQSGDILGLFQPRMQNSRLNVYFDTTTGPTNFYMDTQSGNEDVPLETFTTTGSLMAQNMPLVTAVVSLATSQTPRPSQKTTPIPEPSSLLTMGNSMTTPLTQGQHSVPGITSIPILVTSLEAVKSSSALASSTIVPGGGETQDLPSSTAIPDIPTPSQSRTAIADIPTPSQSSTAVVSTPTVSPTSSQNLQSTPRGSPPEPSSTSRREGITSTQMLDITMSATPLPPSPTVTVASSTSVPAVASSMSTSAAASSMSTSAVANSMLSGESSTSIQVPGSTLLSGSSDVPYTTETSVQMPSMTPTLTTVKLSSSTAIPSPTQDETSSKPAPTTPQPTRPVGDGVGERSSGDSSGGLIAGVVIAVVVTILIVLGIIILAVFVLRRRKRAVVKINSYDNPMDCMKNPVYTGDIPGHYIHGGATVATNGTTTILKAPDVLYEDVASCGVYQTVEDTQQQHEATLRSESQYKSQGPRRNIYSNMSDDFTAPLSRVASLYKEPVQKSQSICQGGTASHYEWGIHVPTQDQRKLIDFGASGPDYAECEVHENIYASIAEAQQCSSFFEESGTYWRPSSEPSELYEQLATKKYREIPRNQIQMTAHLGAGQFGTVNKGVWQSRAGAKDVAVKMLKEGSSEEEKVKFLQESAINGQFRHVNVVRLLGVVTLDEPVMIVLELLANGDLRNYIIKQRPVPGELVPPDTPKMFLQFCQQIASGMEYLSRKGFVHRDLAARNILVSADKTCKISDFGMSRDLEDENYYISHGGKVPVKWTAPEALHYKKYTSASDVWSYGALMYEMWSLGHKPFEGYTNAQTIELIDSKYRLPPPPGCPKEVYKIMIHCWHPDRSSRPAFTQLSEALSESETELLVWSEEDVNIHTHAMNLGAALDAGKDLYPDLQKIYM